MSRNRRNRAVVGATPNDVIGVGTPDLCVVGYDEYGCPVVGSFFGSLANVLNPVNVAKTAWNAGTMPFRAAYQLGRTVTQPFVSETQKLRSLFGGGGGSAPAQPPSMPPGMSYMPPGAYAPQQGWGAAPPPAPPPQPYPTFAPPNYGPAYGPPASSYAPPPPQYAPQYAQPQYDPAQYGAALADFGNQPTGWDAAYGSGM